MSLATDTTPEELKVFLQEADELLQLLAADFVRLEREQANPDLLQEIFRAAHTLKGSSGMLGHQQMAAVAHAMESVLDKLRKGTLSVNAGVVDALLGGLDTLKLLRDGITSSQETQVDIAPALAQFAAIEKGEPGLAAGEASAEAGASPALTAEEKDSLQTLLTAGHRVYNVNVAFSSETTWAAVRCFQVLTELSKAGSVVRCSPSREEIEQEKVGKAMALVFASQQDAETLKQAVSSIEDVATVTVGPFNPEDKPKAAKAPTADDTAHQKATQQQQTVRIDVERLDDLMNTMGELVIDRTRIVQICRSLEARYKDDELVLALHKTSAHIVKVVDGLQQNTMKLRMLPVGGVFSSFPRMVRDLARKAGKKLDFVVEGQDTEIDRTVIERIKDPLVHLLRNAVDHGIETPEQRLAADKPETATIRLSAFHEQGHIVITVEDNGKGIDPRLVKESAIKKGLISAEAASKLSDAEAVDLIFMPGVSTAKQTTEISGRGVGMDIVRTNVEAVNGFVLVDTVVGKGTKFTLKLPLTLATLQALLFSMCRTDYAIPLTHVLEAVKLNAGDIKTIGENEVIRLRGRVIPLLRLSTVLGVGEETRSANPFAIVVRSGDRLVSLAVDSVVETQEIVAKSMGKYIGEVRGIAGASILGDGRVVLILDVPTLIKHCQGQVKFTLAGEAA